MSDAVERLKNEAYLTGHAVGLTSEEPKETSVNVERVHYDLMNKLFSTLNDRKGFEISMRGGPGEGRLFLSYEGVTFILDVDPSLASVIESENSKLFK